MISDLLLINDVTADKSDQKAIALPHELLMFRENCITFFSAILDKENGKIIHVKVSHHSLVFFVLGLREIEVHDVLLLFLSKDRVFLTFGGRYDPVLKGSSQHITQLTHVLVGQHAETS